MEVWKLKACPRCKGALFKDRDANGPFITCISCGWSKDLTVATTLPIAKDDALADREGIGDGCNVAPTCFQCPLRECAWEAPVTRATYLKDQQVMALFEQHKPLGTAGAVAVVAEELRVTRRTVYRALKRNIAPLGVGS